MSLSKKDFQACIRAIANEEFADIPEEENINHSFSEEFENKMDVFIGSENKKQVNIKKILKVACCFCVVIIAITVIITSSEPYKEMKLEKLGSKTFPITKSIDSYERLDSFPSKMFDTTDKEKMVGFVDYVFVAKVDEIVGTEYRDLYYNEKNEIIGTPFTKYNITILKNIKGNLDLNKQVSLSKRGGVSLDEKNLILDYGDTLPKENSIYIFLAYADENGELYISDDCGNVFVKSTDTQLYNTENAVLNNSILTSQESDKLISEYETAYKNQDLSERRGERYSCIHEVK